MTNQAKAIALISGRGSNLSSLIERAKSYKIISVISDNLEAKGLAIAKDKGIPAIGFNPKDYPNRKELKKAIFSRVLDDKPDLVALAGFMQIVDAEYVDILRGKLVNIHPALLPAFPGLDTHERAIAAKEKQHGCTVHFVDKGVDTGPIIAQASCPILPLDSPDTLAERVLSYEHVLYPWVFNMLASGGIRLEANSVQYSKEATIEAKENGFYINA